MMLAEQIGLILLSTSVCQNLPARVRALVTSWRKHSFLAESFFGGGLVEDHHDMMLAEQIGLILLLTSVCQNLPARVRAGPVRTGGARAGD
jgi:hypothetical protein